jgi:transaldolase
MKIKIYADGSDYDQIVNIYNNRFTNNIHGFTTNPTLMCKAGVSDYLEFAKKVLMVVKESPISFEVFADDFNEMHRQALILSKLAPNVYVKIPVMNTQKQTSYNIIRELSDLGVKLNVTAVFTIDQINEIYKCLNPKINSIVSIFGGRIADTGVNPEISIIHAVKNRPSSNIEVLWASPREVYNIYQADSINCDIITVTPDLIKKFIELQGKDLEEYSLETVKMFYNDACRAGFKL